MVNDDGWTLDASKERKGMRTPGQTYLARQWCEGRRCNPEDLNLENVYM
jgi:hypothetical protein